MEEQKAILIVDDSDLVVGVLASQLEKAGFNIYKASNGIEGIEMAYKHIPDLIIMDVEMPLLQGYQASRMLKSRRGVKSIPIIMHTSLSEDKDKFWAYSSGANDFVHKDFDNMQLLIDKVNKHINHQPFQLEVIKEDASKITREYIFEMMGNILDNQLFQSTIMNQIADVGRSIGSLSETIKSLMELIGNICENHISIIMLKFNKQVIAFINPSEKVHESDVDDFLNVCLPDYHELFPDLNLDEVEKIVLNISERTDYNKIRLDKKKISSYTFFELMGKGGAIIGSLHLGNFSNNYFSEKINTDIIIFSYAAGIIIENAVLFKQISEMENKIRNVFAKFVPSEIIDDMVEKQSTQSLLIGEKREVAILFSDIRSFTTISENNTAEDIVSFLNNYFEVMVSIINKYGGTIDKFIGDAVLALFGAPKSYEDNSQRAVKSAIEMILALKTLKYDKIKLPPGGFNIGIGIHEGEVIVGNIGSKDKFNYTVIGDNVNLASRLEGLTKHYKRHIIISQTVKEKISPDIFLREIDNVKVKGKDKPTTLFTVEFDPDKVFDEEVMKDYNKGLSMYKIRNWETSIDYFKLILSRSPNDYISQMYIKRCQDFINNPPEPDWDGAQDLDFK